MQRYILGRAVQCLVSLLVVSMIVFFAVRLTGDPVDLLLGIEVTEEEAVELRAHLGLDKPVVVQYGIFLSQAAKGDLGRSIYMERSVTELLIQRFPASMQLVIPSIFISLIIALPVGVYSAVRRGSRLDAAGRIFAILGQSMPSFWLGIMLIMVFAVWLGVLPSGSRGGLSNIILPAITMGWLMVAGIMRLTRSSMLDVLASEYIKLAKIKGLPDWKVIWKHAFKNALLPVVTFAAVLFPLALTGAVVIETVFAWPGVGRLLMESVTVRDFPTIQGVVLVIASIYLLSNLMVDILYAYINPRIRYGNR